MIRYFKNQEAGKRENVEEDFKRSKPKQKKKTNVSMNDAKKEVDALVTVVKFKNNTWRGRKFEDSFSSRSWERKSHVPLPEKRIAPYRRGEGFSGEGIKSNSHRMKLKRREENIEFSVEQSARTELLLPEECG